MSEKVIKMSVMWLSVSGLATRAAADEDLIEGVGKIRS